MGQGGRGDGDGLVPSREPALYRLEAGNPTWPLPRTPPCLSPFPPCWRATWRQRHGRPEAVQGPWEQQPERKTKLLLLYKSEDSGSFGKSDMVAVLRLPTQRAGRPSSQSLSCQDSVCPTSGPCAPGRTPQRPLPAPAWESQIPSPKLGSHIFADLGSCSEPQFPCL